MRRLFPTLFTLPLYAAAACAAGLCACAKEGLRLPALLLCLLLLGLLLPILSRLALVEAILRHAAPREEDGQCLSTAERLRNLLAETNENTRRQVSTALADTQADRRAPEPD